jgi:hypothetical protein
MLHLESHALRRPSALLTRHPSCSCSGHESPLCAAPPPAFTVACAAPWVRSRRTPVLPALRRLTRAAPLLHATGPVRRSRRAACTSACHQRPRAPVLTRPRRLRAFLHASCAPRVRAQRRTPPALGHRLRTPRPAPAHARASPAVAACAPMPEPLARPSHTPASRAHACAGARLLQSRAAWLLHLRAHAPGRARAPHAAWGRRPPCRSLPLCRGPPTCTPGHSARLLPRAPHRPAWAARPACCRAPPARHCLGRALRTCAELPCHCTREGETPGRRRSCSRTEGGKKERERRSWEKKGDASKEIRLREKRNREERELELSKDLCAILENCRGLSVKQNFPLI